jgi:NAD(P)H dehydrogenase (quinone)
MTRIVVAVDSHAGRTLALARALAEGAATRPGAVVTLARIPPLADAAQIYGPGGDIDATLPVADAAMLAGADGIALGTPVHLGMPSAAMTAFVATTGRLWPARGLGGRAATVFAASGSGGGAEAAVMALWSALAVHGMVIVPGQPQAVPEGSAGVHGGGPFGAGSLATLGPAPDAAELARARAQGAELARVAAALAALRA